MIDTVFTLEDESMTPGEGSPEEGGTEEGGQGMPAGEPEGLLEDDEAGSGDGDSTE